MPDKKSLSIQEEVMLMEQKEISLYDKSKMLYNEHDLNRNAWSKVAEKIEFHTKRYM